MPELQIDLKHMNQLTESGVSKQFEQELRCSHAGETGAVWIYRGILATRPRGELLTFAREHLAGESEHLRFFEQLQHCYRPSFMLPLWRLAGFLTGFLPAIFGKQAVYATIEAVETFVDQHYQEQIQGLKPQAHRDSEKAILACFEQCRLDEVHHRDDAKQRQSVEPGSTLRLWVRLVSSGSSSAVQIARVI
ncbi:MAG: Ubiquinone biosynthesis protein COQ7 [Marinobacter excellens HL-55]|uniref:Ubiquinone biosynthesis protein COQ7 n=1 Tax=Marinobacter excellens HL-55 TaxID=1305731 RepID=A0A0P7YAI5_9GAMM|nr:MAG: Ubiquinone biosynthesis protein COQ7 [Marinobacter excellens HL-55]